MREQQPESRIPFDLIRFAQQELERRGAYFVPVEKEHAEASITEPLVSRLHHQIKKRHFANLAGRVILTFSGYEEDPREIYEISEIRAYFRKLDTQLPELPALLSFQPEIGFNGPGLYLMLLGNVDQRVDRPELGVFDVHVQGAAPIVRHALYQIEQAGLKYALRSEQRKQLAATFVAGTRYRFATG